MATESDLDKEMLEFFHRSLASFPAPQEKKPFGVTVEYVSLHQARRIVEQEVHRDRMVVPAVLVEPATDFTLSPHNEETSNPHIKIDFVLQSGKRWYKIERATAEAGPWTTVHELFYESGGIPSEYNDDGISVNVRYYYRISSAMWTSGEGPLDTPPAEPYGPTSPVQNTVAIDRPDNINAEGQPGQIYVTWDAADGAASYKVYRSLSSGGTYSMIASGIVGTSYADTSVSSGTTYHYKVVAANSTFGDSRLDGAPSDSDEPAEATDLDGTAGDAQNSLEWDAVTGAVSYNVYRSTGGSYVWWTNTTSLSYVDTFVTNGSTYYYLVKAVSSSGTEGGASNTVALTPAAPVLSSYRIVAPATVTQFLAFGITIYQVDQYGNDLPAGNFVLTRYYSPTDATATDQTLSMDSGYTVNFAFNNTGSQQIRVVDTATGTKVGTTNVTVT